MSGNPGKPDPKRGRHGGVVHTYLGYDPKRFPPATQPGGGDGSELASAAMEHMLRYGDRRRLTEEDLRDAVRIDPSEIAGLGPSLEAIRALLEERKRKILETYETDSVRDLAAEAYFAAAERFRESGLPEGVGEAVDDALRRAQIRELERLWYRLERLDPSAAGRLLGAVQRLGERYEVEELASKYPFTGREGLTVEEAIGDGESGGETGGGIKEELETIDKLLEQIEEALKDAKIGVIDLDELREFVQDADVEQLRGMQDQVERLIQERAEMAGLERDAEGGYRLTPKAHRVFQRALLDEIFSELDAAKSGRHEGPIVGDGVVELPTTRGYEFGDAASHIDLPQTITNAVIRETSRGERRGAIGRVNRTRVRILPEDIEVHPTKNSPKCATCLVVDMSGSMAQMGQYVQTKRMAIAMDGLIRSEYPGDFLRTIEIATFAKTVPPGGLIDLMPKPVTIRDPVVRLRVDMADPRVTEGMVHPHFTNIQHGLSLARMHLANADTPNKQVILFTDGLPTAHFENGPGTGVGTGDGDQRQLYMLYPPDPLTERATMREAHACAREGITINVCLLPSWSQDEDDIAFAQRMAEQTGGRVLFAAGEELDRFVLWDYVSQRRKIIG